MRSHAPPSELRMHFHFSNCFFSRRYAKLFRQQRRFFLFASRKNTVNIVDAAKRRAKEEPKGAGAEVFWLRFVFLFFIKFLFSHKFCEKVEAAVRIFPAALGKFSITSSK